jgi:hypothetical protein
MGEYTTEEINKRYALLSHPDRRVIIQFLKDTDEGAIPIQDLVIHCWGSDTSQTNPNRISTALRRDILPRLKSRASHPVLAG